MRENKTFWITIVLASMIPATALGGPTSLPKAKERAKIAGKKFSEKGVEYTYKIPEMDKIEKLAGKKDSEIADLLKPLNLPEENVKKIFEVVKVARREIAAAKTPKPPREPAATVGTTPPPPPLAEAKKDPEAVKIVPPPPVTPPVTPLAKKPNDYMTQAEAKDTFDGFGLRQITKDGQPTTQFALMGKIPARCLFKDGKGGELIPEFKIETERSGIGANARVGFKIYDKGQKVRSCLGEETAAKACEKVSCVTLSSLTQFTIDLAGPQKALMEKAKSETVKLSFCEQDLEKEIDEQIKCEDFKDSPTVTYTDTGPALERARQKQRRIDINRQIVANGKCSKETREGALSGLLEDDAILPEQAESLQKQIEEAVTSDLKKKRKPRFDDLKKAIARAKTDDLSDLESQIDEWRDDYATDAKGCEEAGALYIALADEYKAHTRDLGGSAYTTAASLALKASECSSLSEKSSNRLAAHVERYESLGQLYALDKSSDAEEKREVHADILERMEEFREDALSSCGFWEKDKAACARAEQEIAQNAAQLAARGFPIPDYAKTLMYKHRGPFNGLANMNSFGGNPMYGNYANSFAQNNSSFADPWQSNMFMNQTMNPMMMNPMMMNQMNPMMMNPQMQLMGGAMMNPNMMPSMMPSMTPMQSMPGMGFQGMGGFSPVF